MKDLSKLDRVHFIKEILPALDKYIFHPAKRCSILSLKPFQIGLVLKGAPKILARPSTLMALLTGPNSDL